MAKVKGPLFSIDASGKIADTLVFMKWKGIKDVRQWLKPANPRTEKQQAQRGRLTDAVNEWHVAGFTDIDTSAWDLYATTLGTPMSGFNAFVREYIYAKLAGKTWTSLYNCEIGTPSGGSITITIKCNEDKTAKLYYGTSKSVLLSEATGTYDDGTKTWTFTISGLSAGVKYYFYIKNTADGEAARTGIYEFIAA